MYDCNDTCDDRIDGTIIEMGIIDIVTEIRSLRFGGIAYKGTDNSVQFYCSDFVWGREEYCQTFGSTTNTNVKLGYGKSYHWIQM